MPCGWSAVGLQPHEVDDVDHADSQARQGLPQDGGRGDRLERRHVADLSEHHVGFAAPRSVLAQSQIPAPRRSAGPPPRSTATAGAASLPATITFTWLRLPQHSAATDEQRVGVGRQEDADDLGLDGLLVVAGLEIPELLVDHVVDKARNPRKRSRYGPAPQACDERRLVERGDRLPPGDGVAHSQPLDVLVEHGVDDVGKGFVAVKDSPCRPVSR